ncbi:Uncharacterised protein [Mycobacteroides abscessus subsp. abscessus]|nr:Uncharacterised protein [Mycobacteroides abscessus subsp. abscessus]
MASPAVIVQTLSAVATVTLPRSPLSRTWGSRFAEGAAESRTAHDSEAVLCPVRALANTLASSTCLR